LPIGVAGVTGPGLVVGCSFRVGARIGISVGQAMVRKPAADVVEGLMPLPQRVEEPVESAGVDAGGRREPVGPGVEDLRRVHVERSVRTERRIDACLESRRPDLLVPGEGLGRIIGRADHPHAKLLQDAARTQGVGLGRRSPAATHLGISPSGSSSIPKKAKLESESIGRGCWRPRHRCRPRR
jgi:hypothetical protein